MNDSEVEQVFQKTMQRFRFLGWAFLVVGGLMFFIFLFTLFDATASIRVNGVETRDFATKLSAAAFIVLFPIVGALLALLPQKRIEPLFRHVFKQAAEMNAKIGLKK